MTVYLDNAATSWPKPPGMMESMAEFNGRTGASPGRSGHRLSIEAGRTVEEARALTAELINARDSLRIAFTKNATEALNIVLLGLLKPGDHVITSDLEHNSVMRPLRLLESRGIEVSIAPCSAKGELDPEAVGPLIKKNTRLIVLAHASNVTGGILPVAEIGKLARERDVLFCVDAAQTAGAVPIDVEEMCIDFLAFSGHKSLYGPQGTGGLFVREGLEHELDFIMAGGTGSRSEEELHPDFMPDRFEAGTPNAIGIAGLGAGLRFLRDTGVSIIREKESRLIGALIEGLDEIEGVILYGPPAGAERVPVISCNVKGMGPSEVSQSLDEEFGVMTRPGLHCAPAAHRTIGTLPEGTLRLSPGYFNTMEDIWHALDALESIALTAWRRG